MPALLRTLQPLVDRLRERGYTVVGPTVRDGAIVLAELRSAEALPYGVGVVTGPGAYRLRERDDRAAFGHAAGPQAWKRYLRPPRSLMWTVDREELRVTEPTDGTRYAFLGVRGCDLRAIAVQDRVLGGGDTTSGDTAYARRRAAAFIVAVACTDPAETCFCASVDCGPDVRQGYDLALTELPAGYLVESGSSQGKELLDALPTEPAPATHVEAGRAAVEAAAARMGRSLPEADLHELLAGAYASPRWDDVAHRCLSCGNCTMVCPTCFCTTVEDLTDLTGAHAERWLRWDSCFDLDFSYLHGGPVRTSTSSRYRQWLTHKLGTWHDQFGESGCVGCGRCIAWCPVGIDITEEAAALVAAARQGPDQRDGQAEQEKAEASTDG
jgi:ferredoxin